MTKRFGVNERMPDRKREGNVLEASPFAKYSDHVVKKGALGGLSAR